MTLQLLGTLAALAAVPAPSAPSDPAAFPPAGPGAVDPKALDALLRAAEKSHSDAVVVVRDGKLVGEWYFGKRAHPIEAMSATKSVVDLAVGRLVDAGRIASLDEPVHAFFPEWNQGKKKLVTVRQLLSQTSCLQNEPNTGVEIYPSPDFVKLALAAELVCDPGTSWAYNNKAVNLLAGVVKAASGKRLDEVLRDEVFAPLGITDFHWTLDKAGNPHAMSGLQIRPLDFAKLGQLMLDGGTWHGRRVLSRAWVAESLRPSQPYFGGYGLLWWLDAQWTRVVVDERALSEAGVPPEARKVVLAANGEKLGRSELRAEMQPIRGALAPYREALAKVGRPPVRLEPGPIQAFHAEGYLGQYLVVVPEHRLVAVRMYEGSGGDKLDEADGFPAFEDLVLGLVPGDAR